MNFKHWRNLQESIDGMKKIFAISWSPNLLRLAVAHVDERRNVRISWYDENGEKKEMFQTKPANKTSKSYVVKDLAFSPDSTKLAVSQSDCIIFVYNLGHNWGDKKVICNKFEQNSSITAMIWPNKKLHEIIFGIADGKIKIGTWKNNSAHVLYTTGSYVVSLSYNSNNTSIISAHMDCSVYIHSWQSDTTNKITTMTTVSYCLGYLINDNFLIASLDKIIYIYNDKGEVLQNFDYSKNEKWKDFTICKVNSTYDWVAIGNYNKWFIFGYNLKHNKWEETCVWEIDNYYSFTALCWKQDFGVWITGSLCGSWDMFESCLKKSWIADKFEITYISWTQVLIKDVEKGKRITIKTNSSPEILKVGIQNNNLIVINTESSWIVGDLTTQKWSEVPWNTTGSEKFDDNNSGTCLVYVSGEIAVIEYGNNEIIGYFRTDFPHPNLISAKVSSKNNKNLKLIAFLVDPLTIYVQDLNSWGIIVSHTNDSNIEYLEFNKSGNKWIYRDSNKNLNLLLIPTGKKITLLPLCGFVQWVPNSEVLVAQSPRNWIIWYNIENFSSPKVIPIKGTVEEVGRAHGKIEVYINNESNGGGSGSGNQFGESMGSAGNNNTNSNKITKIFLDENWVNLSLAIDEHELNKAVTILENINQGTTSTDKSEIATYWKTLAKIAVQDRNLSIAQRCFASLGNYSKLSYIKKVIKDKEKTGYTSLIEARMLIWEKQFDEAEQVMVSNNWIKEAIDIFQEIHKFEDSLRLAEKFNIPEYNEMKEKYLNWWIETEMYDKAAEVKIKDGAFIEAIKLFIQGDFQVKAANLILRNKLNVDKNTLNYLINSVKEIGLIGKSEELEKYEQNLK